MSIGDLVAKAILSYQADVSDAQSKIKGLQGTQREMAQQELENSNARNKQLQQWADQLDFVTGIFGKLKQAADFVWDAYKLQVHESRLETAALGVDLNALNDAFAGTKTHMEELTFAAKLNESGFKLTNAQIDVAAKAIRGLTERGIDATTAMDAVTNALVTGRVRGLVPLGLVQQSVADTIDMTTDKLTAHEKGVMGVANAMQFLTPIADKAGKGQLAFGEDGERAAASFTDSWAKAKMSMANLGEELIPVVEALGKAADNIAAIKRGADSLGLGGGIMSNGGKFLGALTNSPLAMISNAFLGDPADNAALIQKLNGQVHDINIAVDNAMAQLKEHRGEKSRELYDATFGALFEYARIGEQNLNFALEKQAAGFEKYNKEYEAAIAKAKAFREELKTLTAKELTEAGAGLLRETGGEGDIVSNQIGVGLFGVGTLNRQYEPNSTASNPSIAGTATAAALAAIASSASNLALVRSINTGAGYTPSGPWKQFLQGSDGYGSDGAGKSSQGLNLQTIGGGDKGSTALGALADPSLVGQLTNIDTAYLKLKKDMAFDEAAEAHTASQTALEKVFGPIEDIHLYSKAFEGLTKASTSALNAWISGGESASQAFKKAIGGSIEALADQMLIEGLKNEAYAIGALVPGPTFDPAAAAGYAVTGAEFLAGAVVAAAAAKELGAGAATPSSSRGGAGAGAVPTTSPSSSSSGSAAGSGPIIVYGDSFAGDSPRMRAVKARQLVALATGTTSGSVAA